MARIEVAPEVADDIDRILEYLHAHDIAGAPARIGEIIEAIAVLETNPLIGRPARRGKRELIIGRPTPGYAALYRYEPALDAVLILALGSQHEAGYKHR